MTCRVNGCDRSIDYRAERLCQKHYFRLWRTGSTELSQKKAKGRSLDSQGYVLIKKVGHPLASKKGLIREHRFVAYEKYGDSKLFCKICLKSLTWETAHVDHIDENKQNNSRDNLRILCRGCNVMRTHTKQKRHTYKNATQITHNGVTMTAAEWSRAKGVTVAGNTIRNRLAAGWSVRDALYRESITHPNSKIKLVIPKYRNEHEAGASGIELD